MNLWLVRHAVPVGGSGRCYGRTDLAADPQATDAAADALARVLPDDVSLLSSPLQRCVALAQALQARRPGLAARPDPRLSEMDFGTWEGRTWDEVGQAAVDAWTRQFWNHPPGGGESLEAVFERVRQAWNEARAAPGPVVWITHAGVIRTVQLLARGVDRVEHADAWPRDAVAFGSWVRLDGSTLRWAGPAAPA